MTHDTNDDVQYVRSVLSASDPVIVESGPLPAVPRWGTADDGDPGLPAPVPSAAARSLRHRGPVVIVAGVAAAAVVAVAVAVSSGGGRSTSGVVASGPGAKAVFAAYATTEQAQSAKATFSVSAGAYTVAGSATGNLRTGDGQLSIDLPGPLGQLQGVGVGGAFYLQVPPMLRAIDGGKAWAKVDRTMVEQLVGQQLGSSSLAATFDPGRALELLRSVSGTVTTLAPQTLPGDAAPSDHYSATVDLSKVAVGAPAGTAPAELWLDAQGRLRKLTVSVDLSSVRLPAAAAGRVPAGTATATLELTDYGTPVTATAPPADQVGDLGPLGSLLNGVH